MASGIWPSADGSSPSASTRPSTSPTFFRAHYGPTVVAFAALDDAGRAALAADLAALARRFDRIGGDGPVAIPAEYLEITATRA